MMPSDFDFIIHTYTDQQAIDDGVLVDLSGLRLRYLDRPVLRMTATLAAAIGPQVEDVAACVLDESESHTKGWGNYDDGCLDCVKRYRAHLRSTLDTKLDMAKDTAEPGEEPNYLFLLPGGGSEDIWLIRNELGGWTVMFASDY
jgi:hypothetical protein